MNHIFEGAEQLRVLEARESFSGRLLTNDQFDEAIAITGIIEKQISKTGTFKDKLGDYANAFARSEKFDMMKAETIVRDLFKVRTGQTMNQMRETLIEREEKLFGARQNQSAADLNEDNKPTLSPRAKDNAYQTAIAIGDLMENGDKISFYRAYSHQASQLAQDFGITETGARRLMRDEFKSAENQELSDWGKELDTKFYKPQIEAEKASRDKQRDSDKTMNKENQEQPEMALERSR